MGSRLTSPKPYRKRSPKKRQLILDRLWDENDSFVDNNTLSVYVRRLRSKIEDDLQNPAYILTVRGVGYRGRDILSEICSY